jgi:hypothetical protein
MKIQEVAMKLIIKKSLGAIRRIDDLFYAA